MSDWKYYCNDQLVTEDDYKQVMKGHEQWIKEQEAKREAELKASEKAGKRKNK